MKKVILLLTAALLPFAAGAQTVELGARASAGVDYKIMKGLHIQAEEEIRAGSDALSNLRTTVGLTYKPVSWLKIGAGYVLINPYKTNKELDDGTLYTGFWAPRHRVYADLTGYCRAGDFQFSLKERLQLTHRTGEFNAYQVTPNLVAVKSRIGVKYRGWKHFVPGVSAELRVALNNPTLGTLGEAGVTKSGKAYYEYTPAGYGTPDLDRLRLNLGGEIKFNKHHSLTPYVLADFCSDYEIDTNSEGNRLFSAVYNRYTFLSAGLSYVFSF